MKKYCKGRYVVIPLCMVKEGRKEEWEVYPFGGGGVCGGSATRVAQGAVDPERSNARDIHVTCITTVTSFRLDKKAFQEIGGVDKDAMHQGNMAVSVYESLPSFRELRDAQAETPKGPMPYNGRITGGISLRISVPPSPR